MSVFQVLEELNITKTEIQNLDERSFIRIEKLLKAEVKMNPDLDINQVEKSLDLLKTHGQELAILYQDEFEQLRAILAEGTLRVYASFRFKGSHYTEDFIAFIYQFFGTEILDYVNLCLKQKHYRALFCLFNYAPIFDFALKMAIAEKLNSKLEYAYQCISIGASDLEEKVEAVCNLFFFRSLNRIGNTYFEDGVTDLLNVTVDHLKGNKFLYRVLFAMGEYRALRTDLSEPIHGNKEVARDHGAREVFPGKNRANNEGNTYLKKSFRIQIGRLSLSPIWIVVATVFLIIRVSLFIDKHSASDQYETAFSEVKIYSDSLLKDAKERYKPKQESEKLSAFKERILQSQGLEITNNVLEFSDAVEFKVDYNYFPEAVVQSTPQFKVSNLTGQKVIFIYENFTGLGTHFLAPQASVVTNYFIGGFSVYSGENFQKMKYRSGSGDTLTIYRFGNFDTVDQANLSTYFKPKIITGQTHHIMLREETSGRITVEHRGID